MEGGGRNNFWEILRGIRANLPLLRGGYCVIFLLARLIFQINFKLAQLLYSVPGVRFKLGSAGKTANVTRDSIFFHAPSFAQISFIALLTDFPNA